MVPPPYAAEPWNWFLRGVQSAIFYYLSCTPWVEFKHKRKRRRDARDWAQENGQVVVAQPGALRQPAPFQTNEAWATELMLGPGPPKGWKKDPLLQKLQQTVQGGPSESNVSSSPPEIPVFGAQTAESLVRPSTRSTGPPEDLSPRSSSTFSESGNRNSSKNKTAASPNRPPLERRLSNAMENLKESLRISLHPPQWNWKRYNREDEILAGFTERVTHMWNRATAGIHHEDTGDVEEAGEPSSYRRKRAHTNESERYDYYRARNPAVNDMHPPVVSQLPATKAEVAWMLLPPPSRAVMEARTRPAAESEMRWPLCVIGRAPKDESMLSRAKSRSVERIEERDFGLQTDGEDEDYFTHGRDLQNDCDSLHGNEPRIENLPPTRIKHLSDPIIKPPPIYPASQVAGDVLNPKRRDSWQFYHVVPSNQPTKW